MAPRSKKYEVEYKGNDPKLVGTKGHAMRVGRTRFYDYNPEGERGYLHKVPGKDLKFPELGVRTASCSYDGLSYERTTGKNVKEAVMAYVDILKRRKTVIDPKRTILVIWPLNEKPQPSKTYAYRLDAEGELIRSF